MNNFFILLALLFSVGASENPKKIHLKNPSFDGVPGHSKVPDSWINCGDLSETPPDTHDGTGIGFEVKTKPQNGATYLGMVARENGTKEAVAQKLSTPLVKGKNYRFKLYLARSPIYDSWIEDVFGSRKDVNFNTPLILKIWGGYNICDQNELLVSTATIKHEDWKVYVFDFYAREAFTHISFEASFNDVNVYDWNSFAVNGNILLDNCSAILRLD